MKVDKEFKVNVWLSKDCYSSKPTSSDYRDMKWKDVTLTLDDFISHVKSGYSYCHIYRGNRRLKTEFMFSHVVSIDVDDTTISMCEFINICTLKPTFAYETFSNGVDSLYSYRLVFVFEENLSAHQYQDVYDRICDLCNLTYTKDHCGKVLTQLMNGTTQSAEFFVSNCIYSVITDYVFDIEVKESEKNEDQKLNKKSNTNLYNIINNKKQYKHKVAKCKNDFEDGFEAIDMLRNDMEEFLNFYGKIFNVIREERLYYNELGYCVIPSCHLSLFIRYSRTKNGAVINRFKDGEKRRNRLFIDGCIIRKIKPGITFLELLYNLVHRVYFYYDNSDGVLSTELLVQKTNDVLQYDVASMVFDSSDAGRITTSASYCINHGISRQSYSRHVMMIENYERIKEWYNPNMSVSANYQIAV